MTQGPELTEVWNLIVDDLPPSHRAWLSASQPITLHESTVIVAAPDDFTRTQLETRLRPRLEDALSAKLGARVRLAVTVDPSLSGDEPDELDGDSPEAVAPSVAAEAPAVPAVAPSTPDTAPSNVRDTRLNPKYVFETFVIGSSNRFAHAAAVAVAEAPGKAYNPLLVYGDSGLGKTHLLHAIGHYVRSLFNGARVRYVSSEEFTNDFINAIRDDRAAGFQRRYRDMDVLLIDDIQFLEGKIQTQEEFFHTFNTLHNANKQIVITSDRPPKRLEALEDRLRNRFEWGLITDVQPPDLETRIAILRKKAEFEGLGHLDDDIFAFIASRIESNIRELEGALIRVIAFASLDHSQVTVSLAESVLKDLYPESGPASISPELILAEASRYFDISPDELLSPNRHRSLVHA
ncbi:MAG: chromosomal replication initiator protein DnaA, partial [Nocardioidaceae bacterium]